MAKRDVAAIAAGRLYLAYWLTKAREHGTVYYTIPSVSRSGMSRQIRLYRIDSADGRPHDIVHLWPSIRTADMSPEIERGGGGFSSALDAIARDWGFSFDKRAFVVGGCGMDMVFALVDSLAAKAGLRGTGHDSYANTVRREGL